MGRDLTEDKFLGRCLDPSINANKAMSCYQMIGNRRRCQGRQSTASTVARGIKNVAVLIDDADSYARDVLAGICRYQRENEPPWAFHIIRRKRFELPPPFLRSWQGHGIIARVDSQAVEDELAMVNLPVINVSGALKAPRFPTLVQDSRLAAKLAVDCFRDRGFRNYCFVGYAFQEWSMQRGRHFRNELSSIGVRLEQLLLERDVAFSHGAEKAIATWLLSMRRPLAVWAANDEIGLKVLNACLSAGISVPGDVAVLGVDNDTSIAELAPTPLSSIKLNGVGAGYEAAYLLAQWISGDVPPMGQLAAMAPVGIVSRASTDAYFLNDPHVEQALSIIHKDACKGVSVEEVANRISLSRRQLEKKFKTSLNRTLLEEIWGVQFRHAASLLETTNLSIKEVALRCGYSNLEYFVRLFKKLLGDTPSGFRVNGRGLMVKRTQMAETTPKEMEGVASGPFH